MNATKLNERIRELRVDNDKKQIEIASLLGISQHAYSQIELGNRGLTFKNAITLANFYKIPIDYLVTESSINLYVKQKLAQYGLIDINATDEELDRTLQNFKKLNELQKILKDMGKL